ncbi:hypothetical protein LTR62_001457 [Meristemomyces frigidus]|uniref:Uncharacterized protein n=1 Tax=Meristemomyces frigidus TaxID=1508187 RepID=A0AAN7TLI7_9PEZI|nr:hypothetical protein LTR62_001457 [Meristemomyces frigidus]
MATLDMKKIECMMTGISLENETGLADHEYGCLGNGEDIDTMVTGDLDILYGETRISATPLATHINNRIQEHMVRDRELGVAAAQAIVLMLMNDFLSQILGGNPATAHLQQTIEAVVEKTFQLAGRGTGDALLLSDGVFATNLGVGLDVWQFPSECAPNLFASVQEKVGMCEAMERVAVEVDRTAVMEM